MDDNDLTGDVTSLALAARSVHRQLTAGDLTAAPGDAVALRSVRRIFATTGRPAVLPDQSREYVALELRRAAGWSGPCPAGRPVGTVVRHAAELIEAGRNLHTVLQALAPLVGPQPRGEAA
ncbi:hypothetical protein [Streptomyces bohaiensis]|uniref:Uncharacterized protein n=1 Tax=Streptomyces bohaiensis TaxID=1431344 RepID=A0ABX1CEB1_9ACTN|nr:hypothetical protein [Streptomyces bohaiensis]NJQ15532.1 hypothetical protein [Streptomyces bohaiensis]